MKISVFGYLTTGSN